MSHQEPSQRLGLWISRVYVLRHKASDVQKKAADCQVAGALPKPWNICLLAADENEASRSLYEGGVDSLALAGAVQL